MIRIAQIEQTQNRLNISASGASAIGAASFFSMSILILMLLAQKSFAATDYMSLTMAVENRVVFYSDRAVLAAPGSTQYAYSGEKFVGKIRVMQAGPTYLTAEVLSGKFKPFENMMFHIGSATSENPYQEYAPPPPAPKPDYNKLMMVSDPKLINTPDPEPVPKEEAAEKPKPPRKKEPPKPKEPEREVVNIEEIKLPKEEAPPPPEKKKRGKPAVTALTLKYEAHTATTSPDSSSSAVISISKWVGKSVRTIYALYEMQTPSRSTTNTTILGLNYIHFTSNSFYAAAGLSYTLKSQQSENYNSASFSLNQLLGYKKDASTYVKLSGSYSSLTDFSEKRALAAGADIYILGAGKQKLDLGAKYLYNVDISRHVQNKYSADYTFPFRALGKGTKGSLGFTRTYNTVPYATEKIDDAYRFSLYFAD